MKDKRFSFFLFSMCLMMVSGISFAMKNTIKLANGLPIDSIALHPKDNNVVVILRRGKVDSQSKEIMEELNLEKKERRIVPVPKTNSGEKVTGIVFDEKGNVIPKIEDYKVVQRGYNNFCIQNSENVCWGQNPFRRNGFFTFNLKKNCVAYCCLAPDAKKGISIQLVESNGVDFSILEEKQVTAMGFGEVVSGKEDVLLIGRTDNILVKRSLTYVEENGKKAVKHNPSSKEIYDLNTFKDIEGVQDEITEEESKPKETPINPGWRWTSPKMRIVTLSGIFLAVAFLLYSQYFSRMPV